MAPCPSCGNPCAPSAVACPSCGHAFRVAGGLDLKDPVHLVAVVLCGGFLLLCAFAVWAAL